MSKKVAETPLMKQHGEIKSKYPDAVLLFRVGDFYETFSEDAIIAARVLGITLTKRANGAASSIELAGFPYHALDTYLHKLVKAGYRVAICDQLEDPRLAKGIVKRGVTEIVTPGVALNDKILNHNENNYLAAVFFQGQLGGVAFLDVSTGEFFVAEGTLDYIDKLLQGFQPAEVLICKTQQKLFKERMGNGFYLYALDEWVFRLSYAKDCLLKHFQTHSLKGFGIEDLELGLIAAATTLHYLKDTAHPDLHHITALQQLQSSDHLWMDKFTIRNLELLAQHENKSSLFDVVNSTITPMGSRLMKRWMLLPLYNISAIEKRQKAVIDLIKNQSFSHQLLQLLKQIGDLERLCAKIPLRKVNPREMVMLGKSLKICDEIRQLVPTDCSEGLQKIFDKLIPVNEWCQHINTVLLEEAPAILSKGGVIKDGIHPELDELRHIARNGKQVLLEIQQAEAERTGISSLKIAFNNVFGYYLEVTHAHKEKVPAEWVRKQTLTNAERYITAELKEYEDKILGAEEKIHQWEVKIFQELINYFDPHITALQHNAQLLAQLDCLLSFSRNALQYHYCCPEVAADIDLNIEQGRHPVIETRLASGELYVPNDIEINKHNQQIIILTGPNMSGKSALLRQVALTTLLAHMGSFVPATKAQIPLTDKIFTRVGASDNLSEGESTFMVEMNETASIINNITSRSLVILDEIGRGTSTYDGISIAWSIAAYLHDHEAYPRTLFATHYHELNDLEQQYERIRNFHISYQEQGNEVLFLRKMAPGGSRHSFGLQVARMAGMPNSLLEKAEEVLAFLEKKHAQEPEPRLKLLPKTQQYQLNIFDGLADDLKQIQQVLTSTDINTLTPVEALLKLNELKNIVKQYQ